MVNFLIRLLGLSVLFSHGLAQLNPILQSDSDFSKSIAALSAISEGSQQINRINSHTVRIFTGYAARCREDAFDFCNCCKDSGWGKDMHLASCNQEEQRLGKAKELGTTVYIGRYCRKKVLKHCVEHKRTYCVFGSKLARIVETQGRIGQLHIGMGNAEFPRCRGLSPAEFQAIDFSKIDFSEVYHDIDQKRHLEPFDQIQQRIEATVNRLYQEGHSHEGL